MKILHIGFPNPGLGKAFSDRSTYRFIDWGEWMAVQDNKKNFHDYLRKVSAEFQQDITFMQIQAPGVIDQSIVKDLSGVVVNWTWDYREPTPDWMVELAPHVLSCFTNENDVNHLISLGHHAGFLSGFNDDIFNTQGPIDDNAPDIVFMGNNYPEDDYQFPLAQLRRDMVIRLKARYGEQFGVFGFGWTDQSPLKNYMHREHKEAACYRGCKVAINLSHYTADRYTSDRMLRILGCGAFCLSHEYPMMWKDFKPGFDVILWNSLDELEEKIDKYLADDLERKWVANNGRRSSELFRWKSFVHKLLIKVEIYKRERCII